MSAAPNHQIADLLAELRWRGLIHQCTDEKALHDHLSPGSGGPPLPAGGRRIYCGFDPTADSLTIGNLVPIMLLKHAQRAGHTPVVVMGGGTGLIGDPSGKSAERELMTAERVAANVESQKRIFGRILDFKSEISNLKSEISNPAMLVNNLAWLGKLNLLEFLRDIGKHFSVNQMIQKDSVRERLHARDQGISFTEFSYQILQAYDYLELFRAHDVTLQAGGSDQWGNIVAGGDLIRRVAQREVFGLTAPLVTKADGGKFGKTESGAVWLTAERTSPYAYYQFWLNADDRDVERFLKIFTLHAQGEIASLMAQHTADPGARHAHRALAQAATTLLHGEAEMHKAEAAARALFSGDVAALDLATLNDAFASAPTTTHARSELGAAAVAPVAPAPGSEGQGMGAHARGGAGKSLVDLLVETNLAKSKREAREFLQNGSIALNGAKVGPDDRLTEARLLHGSVALLRRGKKQWHVTRWE